MQYLDPRAHFPAFEYSVTIARAELCTELSRLRIVTLVRLFHRIKVIKNSVKFVETVNCWQIFIAVAQMVFADLGRGVTERLEELGDRCILVLDTLLGCRKADLQETGAEWRLTKNERGPSGCAGLLRVVIGEQCAFTGDPINVGRAAAHHAAVVGADVPDADIVRHDHDDVRFLCLRLSRSGCP